MPSGLKELKDDIKTGRFRPVYLLFGEERYLVRKYEGELTAALRSSGAEVNVYDGVASGADNMNDVLTELDMTTFFGGRRVAVVRDAGLFKAKKSENAKENDVLAGFISGAAMDEQSPVLILTEREKPDKRGKAFKRVSESDTCLTVDFEPLEERDIIKWLSGEAKAAGATLPSGVAAYMARHCGTNMDSLDMELKKLAAYKGGGVIATEDVNAICSRNIESRVFDMVGAIGRRNAAEALSLFGDMVALKESPLMVIAMIARQFRLIYQCKEMTRNGHTQAQIAEKLSIKSFAVREYVSQGRNFDESTLLNALNDCCGADLAIKSGLAADRVAVEMVLAKYGGSALI